MIVLVTLQGETAKSLKHEKHITDASSVNVRDSIIFETYVASNINYKCIYPEYKVSEY